MTTTIRFEVLDASLTALEQVTAGVEDWARPSPCEGWSLAQVLQHATGDQQAWAAIVGTAPMPTDNPFEPSGALAGPADRLVEHSVAAARLAWSGVDPEGAPVPTPLPQGAMPPLTASLVCAMDAAVHAWDIAVGSGQASPLTPEIAGPILEAARPFVEPLRDYGMFAAALEPQPGDDEVARLLRHLGRRPR